MEKTAAGILREIRDLAGPPASEFLREHSWTYDAENDYYNPLDEALADYMDCDFCDRLFRPNAAGKYEGITRIDDPGDPNSERPVQEICDLCRAGLPADWSPAWPGQANEGQEPRSESSTSRRVRPHGPVRTTSTYAPPGTSPGRSGPFGAVRLMS